MCFDTCFITQCHFILRDLANLIGNLNIPSREQCHFCSRYCLIPFIILSSSRYSRQPIRCDHVDVLWHAIFHWTRSQWILSRCLESPGSWRTLSISAWVRRRHAPMAATDESAVFMLMEMRSTSAHLRSASSLLMPSWKSCGRSAS